MATYYVKTAAQGGSNAANGLSASTAWATVAYALTSASGFASGDTLYVAPGIYTDAITVTIANPTVETNIIGDVTAAQFTGINPGVVVLTNFNSTLTGNGVGANLISATTKDYLHFQNIQFKMWNYQMAFTTCSNLKFTKCTVSMIAYYVNTFTLSSAVGQPVNATFTKCIFIGGNNIVTITGRNVADTTSFTDCIFMGANAVGLYLISVQASIYNCTFFSNLSAGVRSDSGSLTFLTTVRNCLNWGSSQDLVCVTPSFTIIENYNRLLSYTPRTNVANNLTSSNAGDLGVDMFESILYGLPNLQPFSSYLNSPNTSFGNATGAPSVDIYGNAWSGVSPDTGAATYNVLTGVYTPTERNASAITIAPASTSQSIELYLGATGLAFNTSGLAAYYVRNQAAPVAITLVTQTATGAWSSGGFAEISSSLVPGVYRLDVPNAAFAAGASDVTIVVRGASGTNGAVLTVTLSSGGLTAAQTASAVWGESVAGYLAETDFGGVVNATRSLVGDIPDQVWGESTSNQTSHGSFGWNVLRADQQSNQGLVTLHTSGGTNRIDADLHAIVNNTVAAAELKGALLHTGGDYITADLLTPVTGATSVHIGPYQLLADGLGASDALDIQQSTVQDIAVRCIDANGSSVSLSGATVSAKVYNSAGTLVATYAGTITYAADGWLTFGLTTAVTNTVGTYTITITRTTSATDTSIYGPLRMYVRGI